MTSEQNILPKLGYVKKTCQQWGEREDGALAQRLQSEEINEYYNRNKERNALVREDFPKALHEQKREEEVAQEVEAQYRKYLENIEKQDHDIAEKLERKLKLEKLRNEEIEANKAKEMARRLQKLEQQAEKERLEREANQSHEIARQLQLIEKQIDISQAERDRMLAIQAQNEELAEKDRILAIQAQDEELAKLLQEREKKRAKRLKEKYRLKKFQQQQQQKQLANDTNTNAINVSSSDQLNNREVNANNLIEDTYSDPVDLIRTNDFTENHRNGAIPKRPIPNIPYHENVDYEDTYALPVNTKGYNSIPNNTKKPILPKPNSLHDFQPHRVGVGGGFVYQNDAIRFDYPPSTSVLDGIDNSPNGTASFDSKLKKEKKEKCAHQ